ncbi:MAG: (d)CMP kinase [Kofleriaceae bacterium]|nr:(d)CMP kinase [Kofleriaceae bacterium]
MRRVVVTIDGPAGAGKSTVAKMVAAELGYRLLDTGAIYRTVALAAVGAGVGLEQGVALANIATNLDIHFEIDGDRNRVFLSDREVSTEIRTPEISKAASHVSAHPEVRAALLELQRRLGAGGGVVVEGRDTGTVVFPVAEAKFFLTASDEVRAQRRVAELQAAGQPADLATTLRDIRERDARDSGRAVAPMVPAVDAEHVDTSGRTLEAVVADMVARVHRKIAKANVA